MPLRRVPLLPSAFVKMTFRFVSGHAAVTSTRTSTSPSLITFGRPRTSIPGPNWQSTISVNTSPMIVRVTLSVLCKRLGTTFRSAGVDIWISPEIGATKRVQPSETGEILLPDGSPTSRSLHNRARSPPAGGALTVKGYQGFSSSDFS